MGSKPFALFRRPWPAATGVGLALFASALLASPSVSSARLREIPVHTVEQLYAAIDTAAHCDNTRDCRVRIHLAPGTYVLSARNAAGRPRPRSGSLSFPPRLSLLGSAPNVHPRG